MFIRKVTLAIVATTAMSFADVARAADLMEAPVEAFDWSGFYVGGIVGYGWGDKDVFDTEEPEDEGSYNVDGIFGGLEAGANWQSDRLVLGIEGDISWADIDGDGLIDGDDPIATEIDVLATLTGRLGMAWDRTLFYVEGGGAWVGEDHTFDVDDTESADRWGWVAGVGIEHAFNDNWSAKIEYNYMDFGSHNVRFSDADEDVTVDQDLHTIKVGLNYRF
ncbi:MAG TPA: outer membrane protein [Aestuariivirga sp.]|nr:outer membrane protein [Aestuariivirga sp.]